MTWHAHDGSCLGHKSNRQTWLLQGASWFAWVLLPMPAQPGVCRCQLLLGGLEAHLCCEHLESCMDAPVTQQDLFCAISARASLAASSHLQVPVLTFLKADAGEAAADLSAHMQHLSTNGHASSPQDGHSSVDGSVSSHLHERESFNQQPAGCQSGTTRSSPDGGLRSLPAATSTQAGQNSNSSAAPTAESSGKHQAEETISRQGLSRDGVAGRCRYSKLTRLVKVNGLTPPQLTECNLDRSRQLQGLLHDRWDGQASCLVGELQWAFLAFLLCQSLEGDVSEERYRLPLPCNADEQTEAAGSNKFAFCQHCSSCSLSDAQSDKDRKWTRQVHVKGT